MATGKAVCDCNQPDTCLCMAEVEANGETYVYYQGHSLPKICVHDKDAKGVNVKVHLISKSCISELPDCPSGVIYQAGKNEVLHKISHSQNYDCKLYYSKLPCKVELSSRHTITAIIELLIDGFSLSKIDCTKYILEIDECKGEGSRISQLTYKDEPLLLPAYIVTRSIIDVYPKYELSLNVIIDAETYDKKVSNADWDLKRGCSISSIAHSLSISGFYEYKIGGFETKIESDNLKKEFIKYKNNLSLFNKTELALTKIKELFSSNKDDYPVISFKALPPKFIISGGVKLDVDRGCDYPALKGNVDLSLQPLIGVDLKLDLIQAFATYCNFKLVKKIINNVSRNKNKQKNKNNDNYLAGELSLIVKGVINVGLSLIYGGESKFSFGLRDNTEGKLAITGIARIESGVKIVMVRGYLAVGGSINAEGCFGLQTTKANNDKNGLDLVFYHNGIEAEFNIEAGFGRCSEKKTDTTFITDTECSIIEQKNTIIQKNDKDAGMKFMWQIAQKLTKEDSTCRLKLI